MKYYVKFTLEVRQYDERSETISKKGIFYESADTETSHPDRYIKKTLVEHASKLAKVIKDDSI